MINWPRLRLRKATTTKKKNQQNIFWYIFNEIVFKIFVLFLLSLKAVNRKAYMVYDVEPSRNVVGGAFYTGHFFEEALVARLYEACLAYVESKVKKKNKSVFLLFISSFFYETKIPLNKKKTEPMLSPRSV